MKTSNPSASSSLCYHWTWLTLLLTCHLSSAKSPWFSGRTTGTNTVPLSAYTTKPTAGGHAGALRLATKGNIVLPRENIRIPAGPATSSGGLIDVVISLHSSPAGNNDGQAQESTLSEQDKYEIIIHHFADAIYEMTEGRHKIRNVRIFTGGKNQDKADIVWQAMGHPHVPGGGGGVGEPGGRVNMFDVFKNGRGTSINMDFLGSARDRIGAGYTLAHEWGHYFYGVYDEYIEPDGTKLPAAQRPNPSVMSYQWGAVDGDYRYLNFSISAATGGDQSYRNTQNTRQHGCYGVSCWETISSSSLQPLSDLSHLLNFFRCGLGRRVVYPELAGGPTSTAPVVDLNASGATPRSELRITWMQDKLALQIVIDRSGSMSGAPLANALNAAKVLVDQIDFGSGSVGVVAFDNSISTVVPLREVQNDADKQAIKAAIGAITAGGSTAIYDAAQAALNGLSGSSYQDQTKVVFLLTDGFDNASSISSSAVVANYQAAQVPLFVFGYGTSIDVARLRDIATQTGGRYYASPQAAAEITGAFSDALLKASSKQGISSSSFSAPQSAITVSEFMVDSAIGSITVTASYSGTTNDASLSLSSPGNATVYPPNGLSQSGGKAFFVFSITNAPAGRWTLTSQGGSRELSVTYEVTGTPVGITYAAAVHTEDGSDVVVSPAPLILKASLQAGSRVAGASLTAYVVAPSGRTNTITFRDDGVAPDETAGDGLYAARFLYSETGAHDVSVQFQATAGVAMETLIGSTFTPFETDIGQALPVGLPLTTSLTRFARMQVTVQGVIQVDPAQNIALVSAPTTLDLSGNLILNRQTGLYQQLIHITNNNAAAIGGFRVFVTGLPTNVTPMNASGFDAASGRYFVLYEPGLAPGGTVDFGLEYYFPTRGAIPGAGIGLAAELTALTNTVPSGSILSLRRTPVFISTNSVLIEFAATPGRQYQVQYSTDLSTWKTANAPLTAAGSSVLWIDSGPPKTESPPSAAQSRYYRVLALP